MVRFKHRYIVVEINETDKKSSDSLILKTGSLYGPIMGKIQELHGDFGVGAVMAGFTAKYCNEKTRTAIIRCRHGPHRLVASVIPCIQLVENKRVQINTLYVGATIKQCFKFLKRYQQMKFDQFCIGLKSHEEKEMIKKTMLNLEQVEAMH